MKKTISAIGILIVIYMVCLFININFNTGIMLGFFIGLGLAIIPILPYNIFFNGIRALFVICICFFTAMSIFIAAMGVAERTDYSEDALIVLGCGLHGSELSRNLKDRLDAALEYYKKNPSAVIVVSGGQGPQEDITEASAMCSYLTTNGIPSESIFLEDKATSTNENFKLSKEILDKILGDDYSVCYVTNDFHIYRAGRLAQLNGLNAKGCGAATEFFSILPNYLRESLAVMQLWVFGR